MRAYHYSIAEYRAALLRALDCSQLPRGAGKVLKTALAKRASRAANPALASAPACSAHLARVLAGYRAACAASQDDLVSACRLARGGTGYTSADALRALLSRVGPASPQARADAARYFATSAREDDSDRGAGGRAIDITDVSLVASASDRSALLVTYIDFHAWTDKRPRSNPDHRTGKAMSFRVYLVVRDATNGQRHIIRVPPRFGMYRSATYQRTTPDERIHAATAWTFGLRPADYHPTIAA